MWVRAPHLCQTKTRDMRNVLSLFDGMSCGQIALQELGLSFDTYYASEINKHAISQTRLNFPSTVQLGDVTKWHEWDIDWRTVDLILAGSPCQGFSKCGDGRAFDDPRSRLFYTFVDILNHAKTFNSNVKFLLENVEMPLEHLSEITRCVNVYPIKINSGLVSAQNRARHYWTNFKTAFDSVLGIDYVNIPQPSERKLSQLDILEANVPDEYFIPEHKLKNATFHKSYVQWNEHGTKSNYQGQRAFFAHMKQGTLDTKGQAKVLLNGKVRKLTVKECARLQTIPDWYVWACTEPQAKEMLGNGWTVDVIKHILVYYE